jgi:hypothetical protein
MAVVWATTGCLSRPGLARSALGGANPVSDPPGSISGSPGGGSGSHTSTSAAIKSSDSGDELSPSRSVAPGRKPYFAIHARTVLRVMSSIAAVREMFHPVWASASIRRSRSDPAASPGIHVPRALT